MRQGDLDGMRIVDAPRLSESAHSSSLCFLIVLVVEELVIGSASHQSRTIESGDQRLCTKIRRITRLVTYYNILYVCIIFLGVYNKLACAITLEEKPNNFDKFFVKNINLIILAFIPWNKS